MNKFYSNRRLALIAGCAAASLASGGTASASGTFVATPPSKTINVIFTVTVSMGTYSFPATITRTKGALTGTIIEGDTCTLQPGSVDRKGALSLTCFIPLNGITLTDTYNGTLHFASGRGKGVYVDSFAGAGTYTVVAAP